MLPNVGDLGDSDNFGPYLTLESTIQSGRPQGMLSHASCTPVHHVTVLLATACAQLLLLNDIYSPANRYLEKRRLNKFMMGIHQINNQRKLSRLEPTVGHFDQEFDSTASH
jgi:hypothetical protein